jgi:hypothetical protein
LGKVKRRGGEGKWDFKWCQIYVISEYFFSQKKENKKTLSKKFYQNEFSTLKNSKKEKKIKSIWRDPHLIHENQIFG